MADLAAVAGKQETAIGDAPVGKRDRRRTDMQVNTEFAGKIGRRAHDDVVRLILEHGAQDSAILLDRPGHFRRLDIGGALCRRLTDKAGQRFGICLRVYARTHLDGGCGKTHRSFLSGREHRVQLAGPVERMHIVTAAHVNIVDENLRKGGPPVGAANHFLSEVRRESGVVLDIGNAFRFQQFLRCRAEPAELASIDDDRSHERRVPFRAGSGAPAFSMEVCFQTII